MSVRVIRCQRMPSPASGRHKGRPLQEGKRRACLAYCCPIPVRGWASPPFSGRGWGVRLPTFSPPLTPNRDKGYFLGETVNLRIGPSLDRRMTILLLLSVQIHKKYMGLGPLFPKKTRKTKKKHHRRLLNKNIKDKNKTSAGSFLGHRIKQVGEMPPSMIINISSISSAPQKIIIYGCQGIVSIFINSGDGGRD